MAYSITFGDTTNYSTPVIISGNKPSPYPENKWATCFLVIDASANNVICAKNGDHNTDNNTDIVSINGKSYNANDYESFRNYLQKIKGKHVVIGGVYFWYRNGIDANNGNNPSIADFSAYDIKDCLVIDVDQVATKPIK